MRGDGGGVARQSFETGLKDAPVFGRDSGPAVMRKPDFHAGELPQQPSQLFKDAVAGWTQARIMRDQIDAFLLGQCFARMLKDVLLLDARGTLKPQIDDSGQFVGGEAFAPSQLQDVGLVARGQPHQLARACRG